MGGPPVLDTHKGARLPSQSNSWSTYLFARDLRYSPAIPISRAVANVAHASAPVRTPLIQSTVTIIPTYATTAGAGAAVLAGAVVGTGVVEAFVSKAIACWSKAT